jgi:hypothetical protein
MARRVKVFKAFRFYCDGGHVTKSLRWDDVQEIACGECHLVAYRLHVAVVHGSAPKTVYFENAAGELYFPGAADDQPPAGYERREVVDFRDRDRLYRRMDSDARREFDQYASSEQARWEAAQSANRSDLYMAMQSMSPKERDLACAAIEQTNGEQRFFERNYDAGSHIKSHEYDRSNLADYRDGDRTGWRDRR